MESLASSSMFITSSSGTGKSVILDEVARRWGVRRRSCEQVVGALVKAIVDDRFEAWVAETAQTDLVLDDLDMLVNREGSQGALSDLIAAILRNGFGVALASVAPLARCPGLGGFGLAEVRLGAATSVLRERVVRRTLIEWEGASSDREVVSLIEDRSRSGADARGSALRCIHAGIVTGRPVDSELVSPLHAA